MKNVVITPLSSSAAGHRGSAASARSTRGGQRRPEGWHKFSLHASPIGFDMNEERHKWSRVAFSFFIHLKPWG
jgi:hypothetical protein